MIYFLGTLLLIKYRYEIVFFFVPSRKEDKHMWDDWQGLDYEEPTPPKRSRDHLRIVK